MALVRNWFWSGGMATVLSTAAAMAGSRWENGRSTAAINAVSHIAWGGPPPQHEGSGRRNLIVGAALHAGASYFWAAAFEALFGRVARERRSAALLGAAATAAAAYVTDYHVVPRRLRPGFERHLSRSSLFGVYAALAAGLALGARLAARPERRHAPLAGRRSALPHPDGAPFAADEAAAAASYTRLDMP
jgi:hypothetical protein